MRYLNTYIIILVFALIGTQGCEDTLTKSPLDAPSNENFYTSENELELALNGAYNSTVWWEIGSTPARSHLDLGTDLGFFRGGDRIEAVAQGQGTSDTPIFEDTWEHFYSGISRVNGLLENMSQVEGVSESVLSRIEAEARFLRAYAYSYLTEFYGDVPLLLEVLSLEDSQIARTPKGQVIDQIMSDLDFAASVLPETWGGDNEGRITRGAALALKARVALYNEDYSVAEQSAQEVIDSDIYSLHPDYEEMFQHEGTRNSEVILDAPYSQGVRTHVLPRDQASRMLNGFSWYVPTQFLVDSYYATDGEPIDESSVYDPSNPFENRDPRLDASIVRPQSILANIVFETHPDSSRTWRVVDGDSVRIDNEDGTNPFASFTGYLWRKYTDPDDFPSNRTSSSLNFILIRYAEVLHIYAEAKIEMDDVDQSVLDALNEVRARAYGVDLSQTGQYPEITTMNQEALRLELRNERKVEFAGEGLRWFDIRRWGIAEQVMNGPLIGRPIDAYSTISEAPEINDETGHPNYGALQDLYRNVVQRSYNPSRDIVWAIPQTEMDVNESMEQNPGY